MTTRAEQREQYFNLSKEIQRDKFTRVLVRPKKHSATFLGKYQFTPKDGDDTPPHVRVIEPVLGWLTRVSGYPTQNEIPKGYKYHNRTITRDNPIELRLDLEKDTHRNVLCFFLEHPDVDPLGLTNKYMRGEAQFELVVRAVEIKNDAEKIVDGLTAMIEIWENNYETNQRLAWFLGINVHEKTEQEVKNILIGPDYLGAAIMQLEAYKRFRELSEGDRDIESIIRQALDYGFLRYHENVFKGEDGTVLGGTEQEVFAYYNGRKATFKALRERVIEKQNQRVEESIYHDADQVIKSIGRNIPVANSLKKSKKVVA